MYPIALVRHSFFRWLEPFLDDLKQLVSVGDWNVILYPKMNKGRWGASGSSRCDSSLIDLLAEFNFVDRFHLDHPG